MTPTTNYSAKQLKYKVIKISNIPPFIAVILLFIENPTLTL